MILGEKSEYRNGQILLCKLLTENMLIESRAIGKIEIWTFLQVDFRT
jgi:hypothetical protein